MQSPVRTARLLISIVASVPFQLFILQLLNIIDSLSTLAQTYLTRTNMSNSLLGITTLNMTWYTVMNRNAPFICQQMKQCDHTLKGGFAPQPFSTSVLYNHLILSHRNLPCPDLFPSDGCAIILFIQESNDWFSGILKHEKVGHQNAKLPLT